MGFGVVAGIGLFNWRWVRPALTAASRGEAADLLLRSACLELIVAAVVLALTAALVALPMPMG